MKLLSASSAALWIKQAVYCENTLLVNLMKMYRSNGTCDKLNFNKKENKLDMKKGFYSTRFLEEVKVSRSKS